MTTLCQTLMKTGTNFMSRLQFMPKIIKFSVMKLKRSFLTVKWGETFQCDACWQSSSAALRKKWVCSTHLHLCCVYKTNTVPSVQVHMWCFSKTEHRASRGKNKTLAQIIVEILVDVMALLFGQRCPKLLERKAD